METEQIIIYERVSKRVDGIEIDIEVPINITERVDEILIKCTGMPLDLVKQVINEDFASEHEKQQILSDCHGLKLPKSLEDFLLRIFGKVSL